MGAHVAAAGAARQGRFWQFHDRLFVDQEQLNVDAYSRYARELGLGMARSGGARPFEDFAKAIDTKLARANLSAPTGGAGRLIQEAVGCCARCG